MNHMTIYLLRHGETEWNSERRYQGHRDSPLTEVGKEQARRMAETLRRILPAGAPLTLDCSPLGRARATAGIIGPMIGIPVSEIRVQPLLREASYGAWQGLTREQVADRFPGALEERERTKWEYRIPDGEPYREVFERAVAYLQTPCPTDIRVVVTHEIMSRSLQGALLKCTGRLLRAARM